jgi:uncharacterized membrane protein YfcA
MRSKKQSLGDNMITIGYIGALLMGTVLGLVGGGGSILSVPIFVYIFGINPMQATGYSLLVVGLTSLIGSVDYMKRGLVEYKTGAVFAVPALVSVYLTRRYLMPVLPDSIFEFGEFILTKELLIMGSFSVIMLLASFSMIKRSNVRDALVTENKFNYPLIILEGILVGGVTGFVGAGGGFLIIPALVVLAGLKMKEAVGTSLIIIAVKSLIGFSGDLQTLPNIDWSFLLSFTVLSIIGMLVGIFLSRKVSSSILKPAFGWFVLVMASMMLIKELVV